MTELRRVLGLLMVVTVVGCGAPGEKTVKEIEKETVGVPMMASKKGFGSGLSTRKWAPGIEAVYQKSLEAGRGTNRVVAIHYSARGGALYNAYMLFWDDTGPFRTVRATLRYKKLDEPIWQEEEMPRSEGEAILRQILDFPLDEILDDDSQQKRVFGEGGVRFHLVLDGKKHEFWAWAPFALAEAGEPHFRDLLMVLKTVVPSLGKS